MIVTRDEKGNVTKVVITQKEFGETCDDYKSVITEEDAIFWGKDGDVESGRKFIGKRTWMPPCWVYGYTCLLVEGKAFEIIETPKDETDFILKSYSSWLSWANDKWKRGDWYDYKPTSFECFKGWLSMGFKDHKNKAQSLHEKFCKKYGIAAC